MLGCPEALWALRAVVFLVDVVIVDVLAHDYRWLEPSRKLSH
jgi:hypothetical protein